MGAGVGGGQRTGATTASRVLFRLCLACGSLAAGEGTSKTVTFSTRTPCALPMAQLACPWVWYPLITPGGSRGAELAKAHSWGGGTRGWGEGGREGGRRR